MSLLGTAAAWLLEPPDEPAPNLAAVTPPPPAAGEAPLSRLAVLGPPAAVPPLAATVALACRARARVPAALVALWRPPGDEEAPPGPNGPALPGAAALAARLSRRELPVSARGRLGWLLLPGDPAAAVPMLRHAEAAAGDLPVVLALARPRDAAVDAVLAERELLVVAAAPGSPLARAAADAAAPLRIPIRACAPLPPGAPRLAALAGLRGPRLDLWPAPSPSPVLRLPGPRPSEEVW
jgi:hypothetical protein